MRRDLALVVAVVVVSLVLVGGAYLAGARYLRSTAWAGDSGQPVTFIEIDGLRLD